jgi:hypothetical protein
LCYVVLKHESAAAAASNNSRGEKIAKTEREKLDLTKDHVDRKRRNKSQTRIFTAMPTSDNRSASPSVDDALEIDNPIQQIPSLAYLQTATPTKATSKL